MTSNENDNKIIKPPPYKIYFEKNKEYILQKYICPECSGSYSLTSKKRHNNTKKHQKSIELKKNTDNQHIINIEQDISRIKDMLCVINEKIKNI